MIHILVFPPAVRLKPIPDVVDIFEICLLVGQQLSVLPIASAKLPTAPLVRHCVAVLVLIARADDLVVILLQKFEKLVARVELHVTSTACRLFSGARFYPRPIVLDDFKLVGVDILVNDLVDVLSQLPVAFLLLLDDRDFQQPAPLKTHLLNHNFRVSGVWLPGDAGRLPANHPVEDYGLSLLPGLGANDLSLHLEVRLEREVHLHEAIRWPPH